MDTTTRTQRAAAAAAAPFRLVSKGRGAVHVAGLEATGSYGAHAGEDIGRGQVEYAPESACAALTRLGAFVYTHSGHATPEEVLDALALQVRLGRNVCATCQAKAAAL